MLSLPNEIVHFTEAVDKLDTTEAVLDALNAITAPQKINVLGAVLLPLQYGDTSCLEVGRTVFLHKSAPKGWWEEHLQFIKRSPSPGDVMARLVLAPYTHSEAMQKLEPLGVDRRRSSISNMAFAMYRAAPLGADGYWPIGQRGRCTSPCKNGPYSF